MQNCFVANWQDVVVALWEEVAEKKILLYMQQYGCIKEGMP